LEVVVITAEVEEETFPGEGENLSGLRRKRKPMRKAREAWGK